MCRRYNRDISIQFNFYSQGAIFIYLLLGIVIKYVKNDTYSAVEIPYGYGMWSMDVLLPEEGRTTDDIIGYLAQTQGLTLCHQLQRPSRAPSSKMSE